MCPPSADADGPGAAGVVGAGGQGVVRPFAEAPADRVDRRQVENVESHPGDIRQPSLGVLERSGAVGIGGARPGEHLVPGAEAGALALDHDPQGAVVGLAAAAVGVARHQMRQLGIERRVDPWGLVAVAADQLGTVAEAVGVGPLGPSCGRADELGPLEQLARDVLSGLRLLGQLVMPRGERIDPRQHGVFLPAQSVDRKPAGPGVVAQRRHRHLLPLPAAGSPVQDDGGRGCRAPRRRYRP